MLRGRESVVCTAAAPSLLFSGGGGKCLQPTRLLLPAPVDDEFRVRRISGAVDNCLAVDIKCRYEHHPTATTNPTALHLTV